MDLPVDPARRAYRRSAAAAASFVDRGRRLSIRCQIAMAIVGISLAVSALLLPIARERIGASFHQFETTYARNEANRLEILLDEQATSLKRTALDYSRWEDVVEFIAHPSKAWLDENLALDVLENFDTEMIVVADRDLRVVATQLTAQAQLRADLRRQQADPALCRAALDQRAPVHRFEMRHGRPHVLVCSPVYSPYAPSVVAGVMMWAVEMTDARLATVRELARFEFALRAADRPVPAGMRFDDGVIRLSVPVRDSDGTVALQGDIVLQRPLGKQRALFSNVVLAQLALALAAPPLLALLLLELLVVRRLRAMSTWVRALALASPAERTQRLASMLGSRAGFSELHMLESDVASLAAHLEAVRASWQHQALRDRLTDLPNRACLVADVERHLAHDAGPVALLMVDLDGFKAVNDVLGHAAGDELLVDVAARFRAVLPAHACAYRLGGDEFAVVAAPSSRCDVEAIAETVSSRLRFVRQADGRPLAVSASTGIAMSGEGGHVLSVSALLTEADAAMYEAKRSGRGGWRRASPNRRSHQREQIEVSAALRAALMVGRLGAWFQPIVDARHREMIAVEALARWDEPGWGMVPPQRFVPAAERSGQIVELDVAILTSALEPFARLRAAHPHVRLHVNASAQSIADPGYISRFAPLLALHDLPGHAIVLELTESDLATGHAPLEATLDQLRSLGVGLSVDDFGVGASSLARLSVLKPDCIKIDGSFVRDLDGSGGAICRVVIELARELGLGCIAEYVETDAQAVSLARMGCEALQGFGTGRPEPAEAFVARRVASPRRLAGNGPRASTSA